MKKVYAIAPLFSEEMRQMELRQAEFLAVDAKDWRFDDDEEDLKPYQVVNGIAMMDIRGKMLGEGNWFTRAFGVASYDQIGDAMAMMATDESVEKVLISFSSPGGQVSGISDLSDSWKKLNAEKPITVHTPGMLASAAVWLASNSTNIYASETAEVGSIGVVMQHVSQEKMLDKAGIKVTEIKSAPLKHVGSSAKDLSKEELAHLQDKVMETAELFKKQMYTTRPGIQSAAFTGETFSSYESQQLGLIDGVKTFSDVFTQLSADASGGTNHNSYLEEKSMKRKVTAAMYESAVAAGADPKKLEIVSQEEYDAWLSEQDNSEGTTVQQVTQEMYDAAIAAGGEPEDFEVISQEAFDALESEGAGDGEGSEGDGDAGDETLAAQVAALTHDLEVSTAIVLAHTEHIEELEAALAAASSDPLRVIAQDRIATMRVALGLTTIDMKDFPVESLLAEYNALDTQFKAAYKVGGHAPVKKTEGEEDPPAKPAKVTNIESARIKAVGIK